MSGLKNAYYVYPRTDSGGHPNRLPLKKDLSRPITKQLCNANSTSVGLTCKSSSDRFTGWLLTFIGVSLYWINIYIVTIHASVKKTGLNNHCGPPRDKKVVT